MFGLFNRRPQAGPDWHGVMGWRALTYQEGERWLSLQIEPMHEGACRVYVPSARTWRLQAPGWARERREAILHRVRDIAWNRDLEWLETEQARLLPRHALSPQNGTLESTPDGQRLLRMRLFNPDAVHRWSRRESKRAWCAGTEQACRQASGWLSCEPRTPVPGSVYRDIELATLSRNPNVMLSFAAIAR